MKFGDFELDADRGELRRSGRRIKVNPQPLQVLRLLLERPGAVVSRDAIRRALWPEDTFVDFELGINSVIRQLRSSLGDDATEPRYIETVPRQGYRFICSIEESPPPPVRDGRAAYPWRWLVLVPAVAAVAYLLWPPSSDDLSDELLSGIPVTTLEGLEREPALSPDGQRVAYTWDGGPDGVRRLYVRLVDSGDALALTEGPGDVFTPAWHPDGSTIAFLRHERDDSSNERIDRIYTVPALGGRPRSFGALNSRVPFHGLSWSPDGRHLAISETHELRNPNNSPNRIVLLSMSSGEKTPLTEPTPDLLGDLQPAFSPDGLHVAFVRMRRNSRGFVFVQRVAGGEAWRISGDEDDFFGGVAWLDTKRVLYTTVRRLRTRGQLWLASIDGGALRQVAIRDSAAYLSAVQGRLVFTSRIGRSNIWVTSGPAADEAIEPAKLIASTFSDVNPAFSPDGSEVAFTSTRSGGPEIWLQGFENGNPVRITESDGGLALAPSWSPSGDRIAFHFFDEEVRRAGIHVIARTGGFTKVLAPAKSDVLKGQTSWSQDGEWVYYHGGPIEEQTQIWRVASDGDGEPEQLTRGARSRSPEVSTTGKVYFHREGSIWLLGPDGSESIVMEGPVPLYNWTVWRDRIVYARNDDDDDATRIEMFDLMSGDARVLSTVHTTDGRTPGAGINGLSVSPDGRFVLHSEVEITSDLMMVDLLR